MSELFFYLFLSKVIKWVLGSKFAGFFRQLLLNTNFNIRDGIGRFLETIQNCKSERELKYKDEEKN